MSTLVCPFVSSASSATQGPAELGLVRCGRCRHEHTPEAWQELEIIDRIIKARIRGLVTAWPEGVAIEIRRCRACGSSIARKDTLFRAL
jgi:hypothetical protein